ncbi:protealysin inhibitor emfourin [Kitasatospora sp. LaBMicrA B282]|uniref:protealysin inhibitor emfourin n=1 Tax=Kitasatospora sp. LaBMicrA B282 TaxID=3420949 RepID=UPI003D11AC6F
MRIEVTRSGGFTGQLVRAELETANRIDAPHVHALAREAVAGAARSPSYGVPDGYHYAITVDGRTVHCADPRLTDSQRELIALVLQQGTVVPLGDHRLTP